MLHRYETDGAEIYRQSFATIRREAALERFTPVEERVVVRMIHAAGLVELAPHVAFSPGMAEAAAQARSEEHTSELQSQSNLVCRLLLETKIRSVSDRAKAQHPSATV